MEFENDQETKDTFAPEIIVSKDKSTTVRVSEYYDERNKLVKFVVRYREVKPNNSPEATAVMFHDFKGYGIVFRKGKDRFWRMTAAFSLSEKDDSFKNKVFDPPLIVQDKNWNQQLLEAEDDIPQIRKI